MKKVSIVIPAYNAEQTIKNAIDSVLNQNYNDSYELIIINDHSEDKTEEICKEYQQKYPDKIKYYKNEKGKKGVGSARNKGIEKSNSKYIMFLDSDDCYDSKILKIMVNEIEKKENDIVICGYQKIMLKNGSRRDFIPPKIEANNLNEIKNTIEILQSKHLFNGPSCKIYNMEIIKKHQLRFDECIQMGEDYRFNINYMRYTKSLSVIPQYLYYYNINENGLSLKYTDNRLSIKLDNILYHKTFYKEKRLNVEYTNKRYILTFFSGIAMIVDILKRKEAIRKIEEQINDLKFRDSLKEIKKETKSMKINFLCKIASIKNAKLMWVIGWSAGKAKKTYKKLKIE